MHHYNLKSVFFSPPVATDGLLVRYKLCERGVEVLSTTPACNLKRFSHVELASGLCLLDNSPMTSYTHQ